MRIALVTVLYKNAVKYLYESKPGLRNLPFDQQKKCVDKNISLWASGWETAFADQGIESISIPTNAIPLQLKWCEENRVVFSDNNDIVIRQLQIFKPEIIWFDSIDIRLIRKIKDQVKSVRIILGWAGSAIMDLDVLRESDIVFSCAPETVNKLNLSGIKAYHLNHAFNPALLEDPEISKETVKHNLIFIGQVFRGSDFHYQREILLKKLAMEFDLTLFSSIYNLGPFQIVKSVMKKISYYIVSPFLNLGPVRKKIGDNRYLKEIERSQKRTFMPYDQELRSISQREVYGLNMLNIIRNARVVLNIHADSSPEYASNMRLFETTGIGTCLITDWRKNLGNLFIEDKEVAVYKSDSECVEKIKWLLDNPQECSRIGRAGQKRTLSDHTYSKRLVELMDIINRKL